LVIECIYETENIELCLPFHSNPVKDYSEAQISTSAWSNLGTWNKNSQSKM